MFSFIGDIFSKKAAKPKYPAATYEEAVNHVAASFKEAFDSAQSKGEPLSVDDPFFHFTVGMNVRNELGLWDKESDLHKHMLGRFRLSHADDTGTLIMNAALAQLKFESYDPTADIERFKRHWAMFGVDPATMEKVEPTRDSNG